MAILVPVRVDIDADFSDVGVDFPRCVTLLQVVHEVVHGDLGHEDKIPHTHIVSVIHLEFFDLNSDELTKHGSISAKKRKIIA